MADSNTNNTPLPLPAPPPPQEQVPPLNVDGETKMKFDALGPLVVNSDGTLSRIANWPNMTEIERERTLRVLTARNKIRIADQEAKLNEESTSQA
ncbi:hypothetical protein NM688_g200 [Phlebia brevispora]|uniref:Uncharacterized protein n=1 Tax=Phlebia brevispora TaxID=194682 RepID=A0ACC1TF17_9APHY|nr:hypothetical protein NM688_g200 [Phlebia brevispora]